MAVNIGSLTLVSGLFFDKKNSKNLQLIHLWYDFDMEKLRIYLLLLVVFFHQPELRTRTKLYIDGISTWL